jgi:hypothetical protein
MVGEASHGEGPAARERGQNGRFCLGDTAWACQVFKVGRKGAEKWCTTPVALRGKHGAVHRYEYLANSWSLRVICVTSPTQLSRAASSARTAAFAQRPQPLFGRLRTPVFGRGQHRPGSLKVQKGSRIRSGAPPFAWAQPSAGKPRPCGTVPADRREP